MRGFPLSAIANGSCRLASCVRTHMLTFANAYAQRGASRTTSTLDRRRMSLRCRSEHRAIEALVEEGFVSAEMSLRCGSERCATEAFLEDGFRVSRDVAPL